MDNKEVQSSRRLRRMSWRMLKFAGLGLLFSVLLVAAYYSFRTVVSRRSFSGDWFKTRSPPADLMAGRWVGEWKSLGVGDKGEIQCVITRKNDKEYHGQFLSEHYVIFQSNEHVTLFPKKETGKWKLEGTVSLGPEGMHAYTGYVENATFFLEWHSALDHGELTLHREPREPTNKVARLR